MQIDIRVHTDHITTDDLAVFAALAALTPGTPTHTTAVLNGVKGTPDTAPEPAPGTPTPTTAVLNGVKGTPEVSPEPARPAPEPEPAEEPTETKLAAAKRELTEEVAKLASRVDLLELSNALSELGWRVAPKPRRFRHYGPQRAFIRPANESLI